MVSIHVVEPLKPAPNPCRGCGGEKFIGDGLYCTGCKEVKAKRAERSAKAHGKRVVDVYGITAMEYAAILAAQGGVCAICLRKPGKKRLAVDHSHDKEVSGKATRESIRGLLCRNCNYVVLGWLKDDPVALQRAIDYLAKPPAREVLSVPTR